MKYRKKPVVVEATQWWIPGMDGVRAFVSAKPPDTSCPHCGVQLRDHGSITTLEGDHIVCPGDWIITGVQGEVYLCKPDIFAATYEPAEAALDE